MTQYRVHYTETESKFIIVEANSIAEAEEKAENFLSGDSEDVYTPQEGSYYEWSDVQAEEITQ